MELGTQVRDWLVKNSSPRDSSHPVIVPAGHPSGLTVQVVYPFVEIKARMFCAGVPTWSGNDDLPHYKPLFLLPTSPTRHS